MCAHYNSNRLSNAVGNTVPLVQYLTFCMSSTLCICIHAVHVREIFTFSLLSITNTDYHWKKKKTFEYVFHRNSDSKWHSLTNSFTCSWTIVNNLVDLMHTSYLDINAGHNLLNIHIDNIFWIRFIVRIQMIY